MMAKRGKLYISTTTEPGPAITDGGLYVSTTTNIEESDLEYGALIVSTTADDEKPIWIDSPYDLTRHHKNEIGAHIMLNVSRSTTAARKTDLHVQKPDGTNVVWKGFPSQETYIAYITKPGDLNQEGVYSVQGYVETKSWSGYTSPEKMRIFNKFESKNRRR